MTSSTLRFGPKELGFYYFGFALVYLCGLFIPLMQNDSAQHASMAMKMVLNNDFLNLYKGENPYLDKPHMHFWLAALSMKVFGINHIAYRLPALLCILLAAYSAKKLSDLLYGNKVQGHLAALIFLSAQTIVLSAHDVRTDAVLTGFVVFSVWKLVDWLKNGSMISAVVGGVAAAIAFSSKGLMPLVIIGFCVLAFMLYERNFRLLCSKGFLLVLLSFVLGILPVLYAYYHQFGIEGIRFILLGQSVARLTGDGFVANNSDYLFFFHTLLWVFLPFSLAFYFGVFRQSRILIKEKFAKGAIKEFLTLGGFFFVLFVFSFSQFKLPHYLNGLIPILAILTARYLTVLKEEYRRKESAVLYGVQVALVVVGILLFAWLSVDFTKGVHPALLVASILFFGVLVYSHFKSASNLNKFITSALLFSLSINFFLNTQFYPRLTSYQGSLTLAQWVKEQNIPLDQISIPKESEYWAFDFYTQRNTPRKEYSEMKSGDLLVIDKNLLEGFPLIFRVIKEENDYRITRLTGKFLSSKTRDAQLSKMYLIEIQ